MRKLDTSSIGGLAIGMCLVLIGQLVGGGSLGSLFQLTAAVIVFGGTAGAVMLSFSKQDVREAVASLPSVLYEERLPIEQTIDKLVIYATRTWRHGIIVLQDELDREEDPYLRKGLGLAVDGIEPHAVRDALEIDELSLEERDSRPARVFESAGGYAPTFGILGAVLGLIHVMENLGDPTRLGAGIAVAFVATVYGVGSANLIFLPIATKLRTKVQQAARHREITLEGILAIQQRMHPHLIQQKLRGYIDHEQRSTDLPGLGATAA